MGKDEPSDDPQSVGRSVGLLPAGDDSPRFSILNPPSHTQSILWRTIKITGQILLVVLWADYRNFVVVGTPETFFCGLCASSTQQQQWSSLVDDIVDHQY
jgi:hypothetical protein